MKKITYNDLVVHTSGEYLTENLPNNFDKMSEEELNTYLTDNAFEPFENRSGEEIWSLIESGAEALMNFLKSKGVKITK